MTRSGIGIISRALLAALGLVTIAALVEDAGAASVLRTVVRAGAWLPVIALGELAFVAADLVSLRALYGASAARIPVSAWTRSAMLAYSTSVFLPAGRVAGEVARAASLATYIGAPRAAAGATVSQGAYLWGNALISIVCYVAVASASTPTSLLAVLIAGNAAFNGALGGLLMFGSRAVRLGQRLGVRAPGLATNGADFDGALRSMPGLPLRAINAALLARCAQTLQCGVLLVAVGGALDPHSALVAESIQLVASNIGDAVPGQAGVTEAAYRFFAPSLGLSDAGAQGVALALLLHVCRLTLGGGSALVCFVWAAPAPTSHA